MKQKLTESPILAYPLPDIGFILDTDASDKAVGSVLSQIQDGAEKVIAYMSKTMNKHEQQYCVTRKELLAVVVAMKTFHSYLYGQKVLLRTDNAAISWMKSLKNPTGQTARWLQQIETYNLEITHRAGKKHSNADALSRRPCRSCERQENINSLSDSEDESDARSPEVQICAITRNEAAKNFITPDNGFVLEGWQLDSLRQAQLDDKEISLMLVTKESNEPRPAWNQVSSGSGTMKTIWRLWNRLVVSNGILCRQFLNEDGDLEHLQLIVPASLRQQVLKYFHDIPSGGHLGAEKTLDKIRNSLYWPKMKRDVENYCSRCDLCAARKPSKASNKAPLHQYLVGEPMERIAIDILGPLPLTEKGNKYIIVICDCFSKWTEAFAIPDQESSTIAKIIVNEFICRF